LSDIHRAQAINYLAAKSFELANLLNYGAPKPQQEHLVHFKSFDRKS